MLEQPRLPSSPPPARLPALPHISPHISPEAPASRLKQQYRIVLPCPPCPLVCRSEAQDAQGAGAHPAEGRHHHAHAGSQVSGWPRCQPAWCRQHMQQAAGRRLRRALAVMQAAVASDSSRMAVSGSCWKRAQGPSPGGQCCSVRPTRIRQGHQQQQQQLNMLQASSGCLVKQRAPLAALACLVCEPLHC